MLPVPLSASDLAFEAETHVYRLPDGRTVPSVTQILREVGVSTDFDAIAASSRVRAEQIEWRRQLGTVVHLDCHAFDDDAIEWSTVDPVVRPYLDAWAQFRENSRLQPVTRERRVFHPTLFFCGTLDGIFRDDDNRQILIDIKTGDPEDAAAHFQTAAYELAWMVDHDEPIHERWSVQLTPDLVVPYRVTNYTSWPDAWLHGQKFRAFVTTYFEQAARRRCA